MTDKTQNRADMDHDERRDELDHILDAALAKYAAVEPRIGLPERVLANLRAQEGQASNKARPRWWQWIATAVAAGIVVAVFAWRSGQPARPAIARPSSITTPASRTPGAQEAKTAVAFNGSGKSVHIGTHPAPTAGRPFHPNLAAATPGPKLEVFPSPQPLTREEQILVDYVAHYHRQAVLIARVTNEELERDRREVFSDSGNAGPEQITDSHKENPNR